jgi:hypothetical protein
MPDRENGDDLRVEVIKSGVATAAEIDQPWHWGGSASSPASNFASQASASSAVRCRPVR